MVAEKTSKLEGINQFLKVTDVRYLTLRVYAKTKFQTNVSKAKRTTNTNMDNKRRFKSNLKDNKRNTPVLEWEFLIVSFPDDCLLLPFLCNGRRLLRVCDVFKFGLILIDVVCF